MSYGRICLNCGSIKFNYQISKEEIWATTKHGMELYDSLSLEQHEICINCGRDRVQVFDLNLLTPQEKLLFFNYEGKRRLLFFLRLSRIYPSLVDIANDEGVKNKIKEIEEELGEY